MEADLSHLLTETGGGGSASPRKKGPKGAVPVAHTALVPSLYQRVDVEVCVARAFAVALNVANEALRREPTTGTITTPVSSSSSPGTSPFPVTFCVPAPDGATSWTRSGKDAFARCVDRALARVYPPVDPLLYLGHGLPCFSSHGDRGPSLQVTFFVGQRAPLLALDPSGCAARDVPVYSVEGDTEGLQTAGETSNRLPSFMTLKPHGSSNGSSSLAAQRADGDVKSGARGTHKGDDRNEADEDLWRRARASRSDSAFLDALASSPLLSAEDAQHQREKHLKLVRRFARHVAERTVNENSWATPQGKGPATPRGSKGGVAHGSPYTTFLTTQPTGVRHRSALEAASALSRRMGGTRQGGNKEASGDGTGTRTARHGVVHVDVRGMEFTAALVARSARFAYVGCRSNGAPAASAQQTPQFTLVARLPVPSWIQDATGASAAGAGVGGVAPKKTLAHKRARDSSHPLANVFGNFEEATLHDDLDSLVDLTAVAPSGTPGAEGDVKDTVDVRAHRVLCKTDPQTQRVSLWFEDAYIVAHASATPVSEFKELMDLVNTSCTRYLEERTRLQEAWCALQAEEKEDAQRQTHNLKVRRQQQQRLVDSANAAALAGSSLGEGQEEDDDRSVSVRSDTVAVSEPERVPTPRRSPSLNSRIHETEEGGTNATATAQEETVGEEDDNTKAARLYRQRTLRLFSAANTLMRALMDPSAVAFAKARPPIPLAGKASTSSTTKAGKSAEVHLATLPEIHNCRDIEALEESPMVEFKYSLGAAGSPHTIMDAQRLRNTMAAMASTLGGVLCIGVTDHGRAVGQPQGVVRAALRVSGFCPAMANHAVTLRDVRVLSESQSATSTAAGNGGDEADNKAKPAMPKDWWKSPSRSLTDLAPASAASTVSTPPTSTEQRVVTVVTVAKGTAPFYASGRSALPYVRGCASTTPLPVRVMCDRIFSELAASAAI